MPELLRDDKMDSSYDRPPILMGVLLSLCILGHHSSYGTVFPSSVSTMGLCRWLPGLKMLRRGDAEFVTLLKNDTVPSLFFGESVDTSALLGVPRPLAAMRCLNSDDVGPWRPTHAGLPLLLPSPALPPPSSEVSPAQSGECQRRGQLLLPRNDSDLCLAVVRRGSRPSARVLSMCGCEARGRPLLRRAAAATYERRSSTGKGLHAAGALGQDEAAFFKKEVLVLVCTMAISPPDDEPGPLMMFESSDPTGIESRTITSCPTGFDLSVTISSPVLARRRYFEESQFAKTTGQVFLSQSSSRKYQADPAKYSNALLQCTADPLPDAPHEISKLSQAIRLRRPLSLRSRVLSSNDANQIKSPNLSRAAQLTIEMTFLEKESGATRWDLGFF